MREPALLTDLYQLTMLQAYFDRGMNDEAVFEFFVRHLPAQRNFLLAGGLEQLVDYLESLSLAAEELAWIAGCGRFHRRFVDSLSSLRFTGSVEAMPEGSVFFADEPILRVVAPLREAQLVESRLINLLQFQTMVASKAVRVRLAAPGRQLVDFGLRRAHGAEAGLLSARAAYFAGFDGTATIAAGIRWGVPLFGTMAHSFIQAHDDESDAFAHFARSQPQATTLLIDTYDTEAAARAIVPLARRLAAEGIVIRAVRIDSGDLAAHACCVRAIFDAGGLPEIRIFASGNLDENAVHSLLAAGAPIDGFGIGTRMTTSADQPYLDCAYKLQEYAGQPRRKRSPGKATWPGRKQVFRRFGDGGCFLGDTIALVGEPVAGVPLLQPVMQGGHRLAAAPPLASIRAYVAGQVAALPAPLRQLDAATPYPVEISVGIEELTRRLEAAIP